MRLFFSGKRIWYCGLVFMLCSAIMGQEAESRMVEIVLRKPDTSPPDISILAPAFGKDSVYITDLDQLELLGRVSDESRIIYVSVNSHVLIANENGVFGKTLKLNPGSNIVTIRSMDEKNNKTEMQFSILYNPPIITLADRIHHEAVYYALIIAIEKYSDPEIPDLDNPIDDAERLRKTLISGYNFDKNNVTLLKNANRGAIIQELDKLKKKIKPTDNLLIFYAGHGYWEEAAKIGYWLPADASMESTVDWFRNSTLVDYIQAINSRHTLLITDACFAGSIFKARSISKKEDIIYETMYDSPSRKAMTSGAMSEVPDESAFIRYLILGLEENSETYLSSSELFNSFQKAVISNSSVLPQFGVIQDVGNQGGDFIFLKRKN